MQSTITRLRQVLYTENAIEVRKDNLFLKPIPIGKSPATKSSTSLWQSTPRAQFGPLKMSHAVLAFIASSLLITGVPLP